MSPREFDVWWAEYRRNPWGEQRDAVHAALLCQTIANYAGKMRKDPAKLTDFLLDFEREETPESEPDPAAFFASITK